jgi:sporulation protein YlmC with PRC-barrel domain
MLRSIEDCVRHKVVGCGRNKSRGNYDVLSGISEGKKVGFVEEYVVNRKKKQKNILKCRSFDVVELGMNKLYAIDVEFTEISSLEHI